MRSLTTDAFFLLSVTQVVYALAAATPTNTQVPHTLELQLSSCVTAVVRARRLYPCAFVLCLQHALSADSIVVGDISHANKLFGSLIHPQVLSRNAVCHTLRPKRCCSLPSPPVLVRLPENLAAPTR